MMHQAIKNFPKQFAYQPQIENEQKLKKADKFVVSGMGGSHLSADILQTARPDLDLIIHKDYGLPRISSKQLKKTLIIFSSYSGNTEEVIDGFRQALKEKLSLAVISVGGQLIALAKNHQIPYIQMPDTGIQPRSALGFSVKALVKLIGDKKALTELSKLPNYLDTQTTKQQGKSLARKIKNKVPIIYTSSRNFAIAYNWKIKFNETAKIPAFYNVFPELNHNEMTGFDILPSTKKLSKIFCFIFLKDYTDHPRIQKRMAITERLYSDRGLKIIPIDIKGRNVWHKIFSSLLTADFATYYTAKIYGAESEQIPMVEKFKFYHLPSAKNTWPRQQERQSKQPK